MASLFITDKINWSGFESIALTLSYVELEGEFILLFVVATLTTKSTFFG